jgi:hypothetical protein
MHPFEEHKKEPPVGLTEKQRKELFRTLTVRTAVREVENALEKLRMVSPDKATELETLEEIEDAVRELRAKAKRRKD